MAASIHQKPDQGSDSSAQLPSKSLLGGLFLMLAGIGSILRKKLRHENYRRAQEKALPFAPSRPDRDEDAGLVRQTSSGSGFGRRIS